MYYTPLYTGTNVTYIRNLFARLELPFPSGSLGFDLDPATVFYDMGYDATAATMVYDYGYV